MQYLLLIYGYEKTWAEMPEADIKRVMGEFFAYGEALTQAGVLLGGNQLAPSTTASRVRHDAGGAQQVLDGPYADTREQLGGYYLLDVPDLDTALRWAARVPSIPLGDTVEVRPVIEH